MKAQGKLQYDKIDTKRLYLPGVVLSDTCPKCQAEVEIELDAHYPYQIKSDGSCKLSYLCTTCEEGIDKDMILTISLTPSEVKLESYNFDTSAYVKIPSISKTDKISKNNKKQKKS